MAQVTDPSERADSDPAGMPGDQAISLQSGDLAHLVAALEHVLALQCAQDQAPHLRRRAVLRLHQAEGALHSLLRAIVGTKQASGLYAEVAERVYGAGVPMRQRGLFDDSDEDIAGSEARDAGADTDAQSPQSPHGEQGEVLAPSPTPIPTLGGENGTPDLGQFDGSADPNPGGRMGMGWHVRLRDGQEYQGADELPAALGNSNNRAEYLALIALLRTYRERGGTGPLLVRGDSQLIIHQVTGVWRVHDPALRELHAQALAAIRAIANGVRFEWIPRMHNSKADLLASGRAESPVTEPGEPLLFARMPSQLVAPALAARIATLNRNGHGSFKEYASLRVGGRDACSELRWQDLVEAAGESVVELCRAAFPENRQLVATALRWAVRGLAAQLAIKKVQIDQTILASRDASAFQ